MREIRNGFGNVSKLGFSAAGDTSALACNFPSSNSHRYLDRILYSFRPEGFTVIEPLHVFAWMVVLRGILKVPVIFGITLPTPAGFEIWSEGNDVIHLEAPAYSVSNGVVTGPNVFNQEMNLVIPPGESWSVLLSPVATINQTTSAETLTNGILRSLTCIGRETILNPIKETETVRWR
jgi:hypothetical protein